MRNLEQKNVPEKAPSAALSNLVGALLEELADEIPDDPKLESVRADFMAVSRSYEDCKKKDLALRFYLATRSLIREYELLQERLKKAEKRQAAESFREMPTSFENSTAEPSAAAKAEGTAI